MYKFGLLGQHLSHSLSPQIHNALWDYQYDLIEREPAYIAKLFADKEYDGFNVTIPYKEKVIAYCDELSPIAERLHSVNTVLLKNGHYIGDNTDYYGFGYLIHSNHIEIEGKKVLLFGNGGAAKTIHAVMQDLDAAEIIIVERGGDIDYNDLSAHYDADIIINATPVGMYPDNLQTLIDLQHFTCCEAVIDIIYNPLKTALLLQAEELGIKACNGMSMLIAQAYKAALLFTGRIISPYMIEKLLQKMIATGRNIIFVGMPGSGKSTAARKTAEALGRELIDTDKMIEALQNASIETIFANEGEAAFRRYEADIISDYGKKLGQVISIGGGAFVDKTNIDALRQNGFIIYLKRDIDKLARGGRPLSASTDNLQIMAAKRLPLFEQYSDITIDICEDKAETFANIMEALKNENIGN